MIRRQTQRSCCCSHTRPGHHTCLKLYNLGNPRVSYRRHTGSWVVEQVRPRSSVATLQIQVIFSLAERRSETIGDSDTEPVVMMGVDQHVRPSGPTHAVRNIDTSTQLEASATSLCTPKTVFFKKSGSTKENARRTEVFTAL